VINRAVYPNLVTIGNLFLGYLSIVMTMQGAYLTACWLIVIASMMDALDGLVARMVNKSSRFGAQIDSFADAISFGLAPGLLVYQAVLKDLGVVGLIFGFVPVGAGVIRLASYNIAPKPKRPTRFFWGLPIPTTSLILAGFYLYAHSTNVSLKIVPIYLTLIFVLAILMLLPIPFRKMPVVAVKKKSRWAYLGRAYLITITGLFLWQPAKTVFPVMMFYVITALLEWAVYHIRRIRNPFPVEDEFGNHNVENGNHRYPTNRRNL